MAGLEVAKVVTLGHLLHFLKFTDNVKNVDGEVGV